MNAKAKTSQLSAWVDRGVALFCLGTLIPAARLRAFPRATLCIACKQAEERR